MPDMVTSIEFSQWWALYPRKVGKGAALKAFIAARKKAPLDALKAGLKTLKFDELRYCPHPATWLNQERWLDETAIATAGRPAEPEAEAVALHAAGVEDGLVEAWKAAQRRLLEMNAPVFRSWIRDLVLVGEIEGMPALKAKSKFRADWIANHYRYELTRAWTKPVVVLAEGV